MIRRTLIILSIAVSAMLFVLPCAYAAEEAWEQLYIEYFNSITEIDPLLLQTQLSVTPGGTASPAPSETPEITSAPETNVPETSAPETSAPEGTESPAPTETPGPTQTPAPTSTPAPGKIQGTPGMKDTFIRCFITMADLDYDHVPELLYGYTDPENKEVRVQVLGIVDGKVQKAEGNEIHGAYNLQKAELAFMKTKTGYFWMFESGGNEKPNGKRQIRFTRIGYQDGKVKNKNQFTRRWTSEKNYYYVNGEPKSVVFYKNSYKYYRQTSTKALIMPSITLGNTDHVPTQAQLRTGIQSLINQYKKIAVPEKLKLKGDKKEMKLGDKERAKLLILPLYASVTRGKVVWTSSDPSVISVTKSGGLKALNYGSSLITATLPGGQVAEERIFVKRPKVTKVKVSQESRTMKDGEQMQLFYTTSPQAARATVEWRSSNASVVSVDEKTGLVTARSAGTAKVACYVSKKIKANVKITVTSASWIQSLKLSKSSAILSPGDMHALTATVSPENASPQSLLWSSSDNSVATVSGGGVVTAVAPGVAKITAATAISGVKAQCEVIVRQQERAKAASVPDGVYQLSLRQSGNLALTVNSFSALQRQALTFEENAGGANQRFYVTTNDKGYQELRPLCAPMMYLSARQDPLNIGGDLRLMLVLTPTERERMFRLTRLENGCYVFQLAADNSVSIGAAQGDNGAVAALTKYQEDNIYSQMRMVLLSEPTKLEPDPTPTPIPTVDPGATSTPVPTLTAEPTPEPTPTIEPTPSPTPIAGPRPLAWVAALDRFLKQHEAEVSAWSHVQLCDMDYSGIPELVIFTDKRVRPVKTSLTARTGYIYSPERGDSGLATFEYEPGANEDLKDIYPTMRLLIDGATRERRWILADGYLSSSTRGVLRYVRVRYGGGFAAAEPLFSRAWQPGRTNQPYETYEVNGVECTKHMYDQEYANYFKGSVWGNSVKVSVTCAGRNYELVFKDLLQYIGRRWYS